MTAVRRVPASIPKSGLEKRVRRLVNSGTSASGFTAPLMVSIPVIRMEKPRRMVPISFFFSFLQNITRITPTRARTGPNVVGLQSCTTKLLLSIPERLKIQEVTVVPMLAPMITPTA